MTRDEKFSRFITTCTIEELESIGKLVKTRTKNFGYKPKNLYIQINLFDTLPDEVEDGVFYKKGYGSYWELYKSSFIKEKLRWKLVAWSCC